MATDLAKAGASINHLNGNGAAETGGSSSLLVYQQLMERVSAIEQSLQQIVMRADQQAKSAAMKVAAADGSCRRPLYSTLEKAGKGAVPCTFQMPMHYPRYSKADYEAMPESRLDCLLEEYGLPVNVGSTLAEKRNYAMGVFLWKNQREC